MNKTSIIVIAILILGAANLYFYSQRPVNEDVTDRDMIKIERLGEAYVTGTIYDIVDDRILIAEGVKDEDDFGIMFEGEAIWLSLNEETKIINQEGDLLYNNEKIVIGKSVKAWTTGVILESYPAQGTAHVIMIIEEEEFFACYVGGCGGELCTKDPEAISTCELLPGMECLQEEMNCAAVGEECLWVLSESAAKCFSEIEEQEGSSVRESRIGNLFVKAEEFFLKVDLKR